MNEKPPGIRIVAIGGSVRPDNYTGKALALLINELENRPEVDLKVIDPANLSLPLPGFHTDSSDAGDIQKTVRNATGVILATPEYHGSYSSVIKLIIENLGFPSTLSGKPVALLGVAAGRIGAIKALEHLRSVCSHVGAIVLPGPISIAGVQKVFDENGNCLDENVEKSIRGIADNLLDYIHNHICPRITLEQMVREA
ncbi:MAG: NAD(P)H-dependent oxidoreductase [bacterium]|nr:NAD(P)H-dependent oxidoreductase [bacterium]